MTLNDIRKLAIKSRQRIQFPLSGGLNCVITEHGIAKVPGLDGPPKFNLDAELKSVHEFTVEAVPGPKEKPRPVRISRHDLTVQAAAAAGAAGTVHDDEEE